MAERIESCRELCQKRTCKAYHPPVCWPGKNAITVAAVSMGYACEGGGNNPSMVFVLQGKKTRLLNREEEYQLGVDAQRWIPVERARFNLLDILGREPTAEVG